MLLHSWCDLPQHNRNFIRREGVGIVMNAHMTAAWKAAGSSWKAVSSRIVSVRLLVSVQSRREQFMTIVSAYAPTFKATHAVNIATLAAHFSDDSHLRTHQRSGTTKLPRGPLRKIRGIANGSSMMEQLSSNSTASSKALVTKKHPFGT